MAMKQHVDDPAWASPIWPDRLPDPETMKVVYGKVADELIIRFSPNRRVDTVVVPVTTPDEDYAAVLVDFTSGSVAGVHVYPLLAFAVQIHPEWGPLAENNPSSQTIAQIVADIKELFDCYGVDNPEKN